LAVGFAALAAGGLADLDPVSAARGARARVSEAVVPAVVDRWQARGGTHWVASWGASPQAAVPGDRAARGFKRETIRNIVFTSVGGSRIRVRFTNLFGALPLEVGAAAIGIQRSGAALVRGTSLPLSFAGRRSVLIAPGSDAFSDPVHLPVLPLTKLAVSLYLPYATGPATQHFDAQQVSYLGIGNHVRDIGASALRVPIRSWYFVDGVDVWTPSRVLGTIVALGDSITDGVRSPMNANARWPNDLARRLDALRGPTLGVVDEGIGGNRILNDSLCCGLAAISRFALDVAAQPGATEVILLEGINDIGFAQHTGHLTAPNADVSAAQIVSGDEAIIRQAHAAGLKIFGSTLTPFAGARYWTPEGEAKRDAVNRWIRTSESFDGVIDFARAVADATDPAILNPAYDSGDHLHPNAAGYAAMARAINLAMLTSAASHRRGAVGGPAAAAADSDSAARSR
ncbi:MAG TPA: SGNH/GDSL hydrolase family protein, partial [Solirubrobacteraceae bacterium]|nr:SGNH/GDSL hydrolase family protein [Solirubrobacteraceae bacterium]